MKLYLDSSAIVPLLIKERDSERVAAWWDHAHEVITVRVSYVEARAALARAEREERLTPSELRDAVAELDTRWDQFDVVEVDADLTTTAAELAERLALRAYDAVQLAAAHSLGDTTVIFLAGDKTLVRAAATLLPSTSTRVGP